jgi:pyruvate/2-oxoglutarate dehydrogenase complex dihydrolipoamide dehydrogenase (E3) component
VTSFDAIIIGAGQAGPPLAGRLTQAGMRVALIERHLFGGTCVNTGCMPTKTLVASAYAAHMARRGAEYGVTLGGPVTVDMTRVKARASTVTLNARQGLERWINGMDRCTVFRGHARFVDAHSVRVGDVDLTAPRIFINVGGRARVRGIAGYDTVPVLTNTSMVALERVPQHLVIIGGSYIGLEFGQMYRRFGSEVTIVEMGPRLVSREDDEIAQAIAEILLAEGITLRLNAKCLSVAPHADGVEVRVDCSDGSPRIVGSDVLLAIGREPNTHDLDLDRAGINTDKHGYIVVDEMLATNIAGVWALGDCNGRGAFTHTSYNDFEIVAANLLDGEQRRVTDRIAGYALYIDPPLGRAGMSEAQARTAGRSILVGRRPMSRVGRAIEKGETQGLMKLVVDADTRQILGAAILGTGGDEAIHGVLDVMSAKLPFDVLQRAVPIHPTVSELIPTVLGELQRA